MKKILGLVVSVALSLLSFSYAAAQEVELVAEAGAARDTLTEKNITFDSTASQIPPETVVQEIFWDFGDGVRTTGDKVSHSYSRPGTYTVKVRLTTDKGISEDTTIIHVFNNVLLVVADTTAPADQLELRRDQAADHDILLFIIRAQNTGPESVVEDELTQQLLNAPTEVSRTNLIVTWTSGSIGVNVLSKFAQQLRNIAVGDLRLEDKGLIILSESPLGVLSPPAQTVYEQLRSAYVLLSRPQALEVIINNPTAETAKTAIFQSPIEYRLLGTFSARTVSDVGITNFMSFGLSFLINHGVPINSIILILMLPLIATILAFTRQFVGIKAFGLITPTMTTLSFLVLGLRYGLIVFAVVLLAGTLTRIILRQFRLLYLPRMALVLTSVSLSMLLLLGIGASIDPTHISSFSVFPALILMTLAEEIIAVQFKSGARTAFSITAWTVLLSILGYYIVSWQLLRLFLLAYPEVVLLTIPINILLGRWSGLRLTEYIRFRQLFRYGKPTA